MYRLKFQLIIILDELYSFHFFLFHLYSCKSRNENSIGCAKVTKPVEGVHINNIDIDRELSRLHTLTFTHMDRIENVLRKLKHDGYFLLSFYVAL